MAPLPKVKLRAVTSLPAGIRSGLGLRVNKSNGIYDFRLAFDDLVRRENIAPEQYATTRQLYWDSVADEYVTVPYILPTIKVVSTSTTSVEIGTGSKSFAADEALGWTVGTRVRGTSAVDPTKFIEGPITSYDASTGALEIDVDFTRGSGTVSDWSFGIIGQPSTDGLLTYNNLSDVEDTDAALGNLDGTTVGKGVFKAADAATARGVLGLGTAATQPSTAFAPTVISDVNIGSNAVTNSKIIDQAVKWQKVGQPLYARMEGMRDAPDRTITAGSGNLKRIYFRTIVDDTHPDKNTGTFAPGLLILRSGTNEPDGRIRTTQPGYYEFKVGVGLQGSLTGGTGISLYLWFVDQGTDDTGNSLVYVYNNAILPGAHPTAFFSTVVKVTTSTRWFQVKCYYLASDGTNPTTLDLGDYTYQTFCEVKYLGPLT